MDSMGAMQPIVRHIPVRDRQGRRQGKGGEGGPFEQALADQALAEQALADQEQGPEKAPDHRAGESGERPVTPDLQNNSPDGRKDQQVRHIDVLA